MTSSARSILMTFAMLALAACGTSSGGSPDGGNAGMNAGSSGGGEGGSDPDGGNAGTGDSGNGGSGGVAGTGNSGNGGVGGSGGPPSMDGSVVMDSGNDASGGDTSSAKVFYFGHSLVGHDMPQMIGAFARARAKTYAVNGQVGWGTPLMSHWRWEGGFDSGFVPAGFPDELPNSLLFDLHGHAALESGQYDVIVLTETNGFAGGSPGAWNEGCDKGNDFGGCAIEMAANLVRKARMHNSGARALLYTNWKATDEVGGVDNWLTDIANNVGWWENLADKVEADTGVKMQVVPVAKILARIVTETRAGDLSEHGLTNYEDLFSDTVHLERLGFYVVALAHYAAIYRESPVGLPRAVDVTDDRTSLNMNGFEVNEGLATYFQNVVWEELQAYPRSGVSD